MHVCVADQPPPKPLPKPQNTDGLGAAAAEAVATLPGLRAALEAKDSEIVKLKEQVGTLREKLAVAVASRDTDIKLAVSEAKLHASYLMLSGGSSGASSAATASLATPGGAQATPVATTALQQFLMPSLPS